jgi:hypothetical protein
MKSKKKPNLQEAEIFGLLLTGGQEKGLPTDEASLYELTEYHYVGGWRERIYVPVASLTCQAFQKLSSYMLLLCYCGVGCPCVGLT